MNYLTWIPIICVLCLFSLCSYKVVDQKASLEMDVDTTEHKYTNELIHETSPYLLQHAHNPVNWYPWGEKALEKAKTENKLLLISIGYSACHWCHVMERESFEDEEVAEFMNKYFVCIKVDREERPDIDQIYMDAVQRIAGSGGWPLNCFALSDGKPFFGGTYFPKKNWLNLMKNIAYEYSTDQANIEKYANELTQSIVSVGLAQQDEYSKDLTLVLNRAIEAWKGHFDNVEGGPDRAPKFPLPNNYTFLMRYGFLSGDQEVLDHVKLSLDKMAFGGIYDQVGGGFARYSTDVLWKVPHFEKMLYDNAQLVSLYSEAFQYYKDPLYEHIVRQTLAFVERELTGPDGEFYSALDADSEGEEGKFYVWKEDELAKIEGLDLDFVKNLYNVENSSIWEHENYILLRKKNNTELANELALTSSEIQNKIEETNRLLLDERSKRIRPGLDDKSLTSWNALMISAYTDAYRTFGDDAFLTSALKNAELIWTIQRKKDGLLNHSYKAGNSSIHGFLEDYAFTAAAFIDLYEVTFDKEWLDKADELIQICVAQFINEEKDMFYFTSVLQTDLITRKFEIIDNVIPSSNSCLSNTLFKLGTLLDKKEYKAIARNMLTKVTPSIPSYASSFSNWAILLINQVYPFYEIAFCGADYLNHAQEMNKTFLPNKITMGSKKSENLPLLEHKYVKGKSKIYVCVNKSCKLPVESVNEALTQITYK